MNQGPIAIALWSHQSSQSTLPTLPEVPTGNTNSWVSGMEKASLGMHASIRGGDRHHFSSFITPCKSPLYRDPEWKQILEPPAPRDLTQPAILMWPVRYCCLCQNSKCCTQCSIKELAGLLLFFTLHLRLFLFSVLVFYLSRWKKGFSLKSFKKNRPFPKPHLQCLSWRISGTLDLASTLSHLDQSLVSY